MDPSPALRLCQHDLARTQSEAIALAETLHTIMRESDDAETIRIALAGLQATTTGRNYLNANPIGY